MHSGMHSRGMSCMLGLSTSLRITIREKGRDHLCLGASNVRPIENTANASSPFESPHAVFVQSWRAETDRRGQRMMIECLKKGIEERPKE